MKKLAIVFAIISVVFVTSCTSYKQASNAADQTYIGMSVQDFKQLTGKKSTVDYMHNGVTCFKMDDYDPWMGTYTGSKFFYFDYTGLFSIDRGVSEQDRVQYEIIYK